MWLIIIINRPQKTDSWEMKVRHGHSKQNWKVCFMDTFTKPHAKREGGVAVEEPYAVNGFLGGICKSLESFLGQNLLNMCLLW